MFLSEEISGYIQQDLDCPDRWISEDQMQLQPLLTATCQTMTEEFRIYDKIL